MRILWLTWRDKKHPRAGGAEVVNEELAKRPLYVMRKRKNFKR